MTKYEQQRNALIPLAESRANAIAGSTPGESREAWAKKWNLEFLQEMTRLWGRACHTCGRLLEMPPV